MRYLVQIDLKQAEAIKGQLKTLRVPVLRQTFDYLTVDIPGGLEDRVRALPGVVSIHPEAKYGALQVLIPIDKKLAEFQRIFRSNPLTGPLLAFKFIYESDQGKERVPTSVSRVAVGADVADALDITGKGVKVAVLDTGTDHLGVQGPYLGGKSTMEGQPAPIDEVGHGYHVATTISGRPFQSMRGLLQGVAVDAEVMAEKVLGYALGMGTTTSILRGMADAVEWGCDIISMSLGGPEEEPGNPTDRIISALTKEGIVVVVAAGNSGPDASTLGTPGASPDSLTVGAVDMEGTIAPFSSRGPSKAGLVKPDVVAPGVNILSSTTGYIAVMQTADGPKLGAISGTSMATPHVAGVVALALQYARAKGKVLTTSGIKQAMSMYGQYPGGAKRNDLGWGAIHFSILKRYIDNL